MAYYVGEALTFKAFYTTDGEGTAGLTVTVDVYNPARSKVVNGSSATAIGGGWYYYILAAGSVATEGDYNAQFKTTDTSVDQVHLPSEKNVRIRTVVETGRQ